MGVWGVGKKRERETHRCNGKEVHGSGKQVIGVNGLGVWERQGYVFLKPKAGGSLPGHGLRGGQDWTL